MRAPLLLLALLFAGCGTTSGMYEWGEYEDTVFEVCRAPDGFDSQTAIAGLEEMVDEASASEQAVPPGTHAFLGYLYYLNGDVDGAVAAFHSEKELYPESTVFMDGLLKRIGAGSRS